MSFVYRSHKARDTHGKVLQDVFFTSHKQVSSLQPRKTRHGVRREVLFFFKERFLLGMFIVALLIVLVSSFIFHAGLVKAEVAFFYPSSCLGGWVNPSYAFGKPDVSDDTPITFTKENSAFLPENTNAQIFCGGFLGDIPQDATAKKILLSLSWDIQRDLPSSIITGTDFSSSTTAILDASGPLQPEFTLTATTSTTSLSTTITNTGEESATTSLPSNTGAQSAGVIESEQEPQTKEQKDGSSPEETPIISPTSAEPALLPQDTSSSTSFRTSDGRSPLLSLLVPTAFAEETDFGMATSTGTVITTEQVNIESTPLSQVKNPFLEVFYTVDGKDWTSLGTVDAEHLHNSIFEIPITASSTWTDMSHIQISIKSLTSIDHTPAVYLDGMSLQVEYEKINPEPEITVDWTTRNLHFQDFTNTGSPMSVLVSVDDTNKEILTFKSAVVGSVRIYSLDDDTFSMGMGVSGGESQLMAYFFKPGKYSLLNTTDPDGCETMSFVQCQQSAIASVSFTVIDLTDTVTSTSTKQ